MVRYLVARGMLSAADVVSGRLEIREISRRNLSFVVRGEDGEGLFVKKALDDETAATLHREARAYRLLSAAEREAAPRIAPFRHHDPEESVLVLGLLRDATTLREEVQRRRRPTAALAGEAGRLVAALHAFRPPDGGDAARSLGEPLPAPWAVEIHDPHASLLESASAGALELVRAVQRVPEFRERLETLRSGWSPVATIHSDLRPDNFVVATDGPGRSMRLVDLEFVGRGDPAWDLGSVLCAFLDMWLASVPLTGGENVASALRLARLPLERVRPAARAFWRAYSEGTVSPPDAETLDRGVRFSAARLLQSAFEQLRASPQLTALAVYQTQLSLNLLRRPLEGASRLLGIGSDG